MLVFIPRLVQAITGNRSNVGANFLASTSKISRSTYHGQKKGSELVDLTVQHVNMLIRFLLLENLPTHVVDLEDIL